MKIFITLAIAHVVRDYIVTLKKTIPFLADYETLERIMTSLKNIDTLQGQTPQSVMYHMFILVPGTVISPCTIPKAVDTVRIAIFLHIVTYPKFAFFYIRL